MDWWSKGPGENGGISAASIRGRDWKILNLTVQPQSMIHDAYTGLFQLPCLNRIKRRLQTGDVVFESTVSPRFGMGNHSGSTPFP